MSLIENIKNNFNRGYFGKAMLIDGLPQQYPAWTIKQPGWYGVAVRTEKFMPFSERFSSSRIWTLKNAEINSQPMNLLIQFMIHRIFHLSISNWENLNCSIN